MAAKTVFFRIGYCERRERNGVYFHFLKDSALWFSIPLGARMSLPVKFILLIAQSGRRVNLYENMLFK